MSIKTNILHASLYLWAYLSYTVAITFRNVTDRFTAPDERIFVLNLWE